MTILLLILKIIGIVLLAILGVVLLLVLAILFVPIRYRITGRAENEIELKVRGSWLLHLISFSGELKGKEFPYAIRIFGINSKREKEKTRPRKRKEKSVPKKQIKVSPQKVSEVKQEKIQPNIQSNKEQENTTKISNVFSKIKGFPGMIRRKLENIINKIKNFKELLERIKNEIQDEKNKNAVKTLFGQLKILLKHISPRKVKGIVKFGMDDPATTGMILGVISMIPFLYCYDAKICPEFEAEKTFVKGNLDAKGYIRLYHILVIFVRLVKDKNVRNLINKFS